MDSGPTDVEYYSSLANQEKDPTKKAALMRLARSAEKEETRHKEAIKDLSNEYKIITGM